MEGEGSALSNQLDVYEQLSAARVAMEAMAVAMEALAANNRAQTAAIKSLEAEVQTLHEGRAVRGCSKAGPACTAHEDEAGPLGLLSLLPGEILELLVSKVQGKSSLLSTCRSLRLAVYACTSALTWSGPGGVLSVGGGAMVPHYVTLQRALPAAPGMALTRLDCSGQPGNPLGIHCLAGCPPSLQTLICCYTLVAELGPLAACTLLQSLNCSDTQVAELGPLAACRSLQSLNCSFTRVTALGPLAACTSLQSLVCNGTGVTDLSPLSPCTMLQSLYCICTRVTGLGPLAACTSLQHLSCYATMVVDVGSLVACTSLITLACPKLVPHGQTQLLQEACQNLSVSRQ